MIYPLWTRVLATECILKEILEEWWRRKPKWYFKQFQHHKWIENYHPYTLEYEHGTWESPVLKRQIIYEPNLHDFGFRGSGFDGESKFVTSIQPYPTLSTHHAMSSLPKKNIGVNPMDLPSIQNAGKTWGLGHKYPKSSKTIQNYPKSIQNHPKSSKIIKKNVPKIIWVTTCFHHPNWMKLYDMSITQCPPKLPRYWNNLPNVVPKDPWSSCRAVVESAPPNPKRWWFPATRHDAPRGGINKRNLETNPTTYMTMEKSAFEDVQYLQ